MKGGRVWKFHLLLDDSILCIFRLYSYTSINDAHQEHLNSIYQVGAKISYHGFTSGKGDAQCVDTSTQCRL